MLSEFVDFSAIHDVNARLRSHMSEQHRLEELLVDTVSVFRRQPQRIRTPGSSRSALTSRRNRDARELRSKHAVAETMSFG